MKFIKPSEIAGKIMTLLDESDEKVVLVSPYVKMGKWYKMIKKLDSLQKRNVELEFYVRDDERNQESYQDLNKLGIKYEAIPNLHCKFYFNEKYGIVTSMNLLLSSEINSLEMGYQTETKAEYDEIMDFYKRYISNESQPTNGTSLVFEPKNGELWYEAIQFELASNLNKRVDVKLNDSNLSIRAGSNNYEAFIWNHKINQLRLNAILSGKEYHVALENLKNLNEDTPLDYSLQEGKNGYYDLIWADLDHDLKALNINDLNPSDQYQVINAVVDFVGRVDSFKNSVRYECK